MICTSCRGQVAAQLLSVVAAADLRHFSIVVVGKRPV